MNDQLTNDSGCLRNVADIDWNRLWNENAVRRSTPEFWDTKVEAFDQHGLDSLYAGEFVKLMQPQPEWTVFDMGSGSGTLALPLAAKVKAVTAADFSPNMLAALQMYAKERGLNNITPVRLSWHDDWERIPAKSHDIAIASRSLLVDDFKAAVEKLIKVARLRVYLGLFVDAGAEYDLLYRAIGRRAKSNLDYACCYNILYQMGIRANISIIEDPKPKAYQTREKAFVSLTEHHAKRLTLAELQTLKAYVNEHLEQSAYGWHIDNPAPYKAAVIWWHV